MADENILIEQIAARLRRARRTKQLTQVEVAKKAGISETYYAQIERAKKNPSITVFLNIISALDAPSKDILGR
jgi:transcriptional regulator with XRE-family HTH domain